ncbi:MAG: GerMN domain-containing protein, partial [Eubacteriales bacterium]|nr:GerMN domain-containing protein [Eubacteriales bacterium]
DDAVATLNIRDLPALADSSAEANMLCAVVNTLTEFPTIDRVKVLFDGKEKKELPHGTAASAVMATFALNEEPVAVSASSEELHKMTLYFPNSTASLHIPVSRTVSQEPSLSAAMAELIEGPADPSLLPCFPEGTRLLSAEINDNTACVNLSGAFMRDTHTEGMQEAAITSMMLTAKQFDDVSDFRLLIDGVDYEPAADVVSAIPVFVNTF